MLVFQGLQQIGLALALIHAIDALWFASGLEHGLDLSGKQVQDVGDLARLRISPQVASQFAAGPGDSPATLVHMHRQADQPPFVDDCAIDGLRDPPVGVGRESRTAPMVVPIHRFDQTDVPFLDQIQERHSAVDEPLGHMNHQPQVGADHRVPGLPQTAGLIGRIPSPAKQLRPDARPSLVYRNSLAYPGHLETAGCGTPGGGKAAGLFEFRRELARQAHEDTTQSFPSVEHGAGELDLAVVIDQGGLPHLPQVARQAGAGGARLTLGRASRLPSRAVCERRRPTHGHLQDQIGPPPAVAHPKQMSELAAYPESPGNSSP